VVEKKVHVEIKEVVQKERLEGKRYGGGGAKKGGLGGVP